MSMCQMKLHNEIYTLSSCEYCLRTHANFKATSLNPFASNLLIILPTNPLCTPSGLTIRKVRSFAAAIAFENNDKNDNTVQMTIQRVNTGYREPNRKMRTNLQSTDKDFRDHLHTACVSNTLESICVLSVIHGCQRGVAKCGGSKRNALLEITI